MDYQTLIERAHAMTETEIYDRCCWSCGHEEDEDEGEDLVFIPDGSCTEVIKKHYVCKNCCIQCTFLPQCKFRPNDWFESVKHVWEMKIAEVYKDWK